MPSSSPVSIAYMIGLMRKITKKPKNILDIGIGFGKWGFLIREYYEIRNKRINKKEWKVRIEGIEVVPKYISKIQKIIYDKIIQKDVFSVLLPADFNFKGRSKAMDENGKDDVIIKDGKLIQGVIDKSTIGGEAGLMLRSIHKKYGKEKTIKILGNLFRLGIKVLLKRGFTTAIVDSDIPENARMRIKELLEGAQDEQ